MAVFYQQLNQNNLKKEICSRLFLVSIIKCSYKNNLKKQLLIYCLDMLDIRTYKEKDFTCPAHQNGGFYYLCKKVILVFLLISFRLSLILMTLKIFMWKILKYKNSGLQICLIWIFLNSQIRTLTMDLDIAPFFFLLLVCTPKLQH